MQVADSAQMPVPVSEARLRISGGVLGSGLSGAVAVVGVGLQVPYVAIVAGIGAAVGVILGAILAPKAARTDRPIAFALVASLIAVPVGGAVVGAIFAIGIAVSQGTAEALPIVLVTTLFSIPMYPLFAPISVPIAIASVLIGRRLVRVEPRITSLALAGLIGADVALLMLMPTIRPWLSMATTWIGDFGR
jgi:hypothetical protein